MGRLTEKDVCGHWRLKGLPWKNLYTGTPITRETYEVLYGALCKLLVYEETGLTPEEIEMRTYCTMGTPCEFQSSEIRKDGWIPVEERLPEEETSVWVTVKHSSWISDYGSDFIPKEEWEYHPESSGTHKGKYEEGIWWYEDEENEWIRCDEEPNEARDLGAVYDTVIAWQPLPEPYRPERRNRRNGRG